MHPFCKGARELAGSPSWFDPARLPMQLAVCIRPNRAHGFRVMRLAAEA